MTSRSGGWLGTHLTRSSEGVGKLGSLEAWKCRGHACDDGGGGDGGVVAHALQICALVVRGRALLANFLGTQFKGVALNHLWIRSFITGYHQLWDAAQLFGPC